MDTRNPLGFYVGDRVTIGSGWNRPGHIEDFHSEYQFQDSAIIQYEDGSFPVMVMTDQLTRIGEDWES